MPSYFCWNYTIEHSVSNFVESRGGISYNVTDHLRVISHIPNVAQSEKALFGIRILIGPITALFFIIANIILAFYPINKKKYEEIQQQIKKMETNKK